jgi:glyoxylase-like metal-dependent hydrolase (beta-lactamase superfamily II)
MRMQVVPVTPFEQNCSLVWDERTRDAAVIDPGGDLDRILAAIDERGLALRAIWLTHGHLDHAAGAATLADRSGVPIVGPQREDQFWIDALPDQTRNYGFPPTRAFVPDRWLVDGDAVTVGGETFSVLHCPGHTPGHVVYFHARERLAFVGDVLFAGSIGRTDFPRGDHAALIRSIREKLFPLGDDVRFVPGHGPMSTFGRERRDNPYVADRLFERSAAKG